MKSSCLLALLLVLGTSFAPLTASRANDGGSGNAAPKATQRLLTWSEGVQVINVAWKNMSKFDSAIDCSHLVNQIYELAGMSYPYATSNELYEGVDGFERVQI